jgi:homocysteine S-methyltransferase
MADRLAALLAREPFAILDGGLATQLEARGCDLDDPLWSARVLLDAPEPIVAVHRAYLDAGAEILTTASYQATIPGLVARGCSEAEARSLLRETVALARRAIREAGDGHAALVAASIGSYGAYLADGSEFRGDYGIAHADLVAFHRERLVELSAAGPDLLAFETIPSALEAAAIAELLRASSGPRAWVSFSLRAGEDPTPRISDGTPLADAVAPLLDHPRVAALGVNCVRPEWVQPALAALAVVAPGVLLVAYPNAGERWVDGGWVDPATPLVEFTELAQTWLRSGARMLGGCCRTGPAHIKALARLRRELG